MLLTEQKKKQQLIGFILHDPNNRSPLESTLTSRIASSVLVIILLQRLHENVVQAELSSPDVSVASDNVVRGIVKYSG